MKPLMCAGGCSGTRCVAPCREAERVYKADYRRRLAGES